MVQFADTHRRVRQEDDRWRERLRKALVSMPGATAPALASELRTTDYLVRRVLRTIDVVTDGGRPLRHWLREDKRAPAWAGTEARAC